MMKIPPVVLAIALMSTLVVGCGPSRADKDAQATQIAAEIYATQTAQVPTATATPTITPTPTPSPTPLPSATPTLVLYAGKWNDYSIDNFQISLPETWNTVDVDREGIEAIQDRIQHLDTEWAKNMESVITTEGMQEIMKLWALDPEPAGLGYATMNVIFRELPFAETTRSISTQLKSSFEQMGIEVMDVETDLRINDLDSARVSLRITAGPFPFKEYLYIFVEDHSMWMVTFAVDETAWSEYEGTFQDVAETFRVVE